MCGPFLLSYAANWTRPASVPSGAGGHMSGSTGRAPRPSSSSAGGACRDQLDAPASVPSGAGAHAGISWTRPRPSLPVRGTCRDQLDAPRVRLFQCGAHVGISWTRPASVSSSAGHMSGSTGRARVCLFQTAGHMSGSAGRARVRPFRCGARPGRPLRPAWHGTGAKVLPGRGTR